MLQYLLKIWYSALTELHAFLIFLICVTCPVPLIILNQITIRISGDQETHYKYISLRFKYLSQHFVLKSYISTHHSNWQTKCHVYSKTYKWTEYLSGFPKNNKENLHSFYNSQNLILDLLPYMICPLHTHTHILGYILLLCVQNTDDTFHLLLLQKMNEADSYSLVKTTQFAKLSYMENLEMKSKINKI